MKKELFVLGLGVILGMASCQKSGCTDENAINFNKEATKDDGSCEYPSFRIIDKKVNGISYKQVEGEIDKNITFSSSNKYLLSGGVYVGKNATLKIEAGTEIFAETGVTTFLSIRRGSKINAEGTSSSPIVFKPLKDNPSSGDWGGIIINGKAPINTGNEAQGEGGTGLYGGNDASDNSGIIKYVRVEYAGKVLGTDNELNGFSFNGVGNGTTVEYIQAYRGADDGIEFFGGTVSVNYAVSTGNRDDSFDWTHGFSGTCSDWYVEQDPNVGDRGIEADNNGDNNSITPFSNPTITRITMVLRDSSNGTSGIKLREGTKGKLSKIYIKGSKKPIDIQHDVTLQNVVNGSLTVKEVITENTIKTVVFKSSNNNTQLEQQAKNSGNANINQVNPNNSTTWKDGWTKSL